MKFVVWNINRARPASHLVKRAKQAWALASLAEIANGEPYTVVSVVS